MKNEMWRRGEQYYTEQIIGNVAFSETCTIMKQSDVSS